MNYITIRDEEGKVKPALLFSHCQLNHLYGTITKAKDIEDDAKRKAFEIEQRKELSRKMADTWENTYINMRKMRFEKRKERLMNEQKYKEKRFEELRIESEKLKKKVNEKAKAAFFFERDSCKALHSAFRRSEAEAERSAQLEFNEKLRKIDREIETKYAESVMNDAKRFQEEEEEKKRALEEEKAHLKIEAKKSFDEAESRKKAEKERQQREEREDMAILARQMKQVFENEKKETLQRTIMSKTGLIANREEVKRHKEKLKEQDDQENKALEIIANGKIAIAKIRKQKEFEMLEAKNARLQALSNKLSSENEEREAKENESIKRAEEERYKLDMDAKERERQYRELLKQDRINEHLKYLKEQEDKLTKEKELLKWDILRRFKKEEINNKFTMEMKEKNRKKILEFRQICKDQIESDIDKRMKEKEIELQACQRAQELWELSDKEFLAYAEKVREESKAKGRPLYPLDAAIYNYKKENGLLAKKRNFIWDATISRPKGIEEMTYESPEHANLQNCLHVQAISADEFGYPKRANGM